MGTRGVIARTVNGGFQGTYHHWDSYPSGLGKTLYQLYHEVFGKDVHRMVKVLIDDHPAGWSTLNDSDWRFSPGWADKLATERRCMKCGMQGWEHYRQEYQSRGLALPAQFQDMPPKDFLLTTHSPEPEVFPEDNRPQCYCHGGRSEGANKVTDKNAAAIGCEWAYVFDEGPSIRVLSSMVGEKKMIGWFGMGDKAASWVEAGRIVLDGPEPDWAAIECGPNLERCVHYKCYHGLPHEPDCGHKGEEAA